MIKKTLSYCLLLVLASAFGSAFAQNSRFWQIHKNVGYTGMPKSITANEMNELGRTSAACSTDSVRFVNAKTTGLQFFGWTEASLSQYYGNASGVSIKGVNLYCSIDTPITVSIPCTLKIMAANAQKLPTGSALATKTFTLDNTAFMTSTTLNGFKKYVQFDSPYSVTGNYCIVLEWPVTSTMVTVANDYLNNDGQGDGLSGYKENGTWRNLLTYFNYDMDHFMNPVINVNYSNPTFTVSPPCIQTGNQTVTLDLTYSNVFDSKYYSQTAFYTDLDRPHYWTYGDGNNGYARDHTHNYSALGSYSVTVKDSLFGWSTTCVSPPSTILVTSTPSAQFTHNVNQSTVNFTGPSVSPTPTYAWDFGDGATSSSQNPSHTYTSTGTFTVCLTITSTCGTANHCENITVSSVGIEHGLQAFTSIQPNPATDAVNLSTTQALTNCNITVSDVLGKRMSAATYAEMSAGQAVRLDLAGLEAGIYFIRVDAAEGTAVHKVVVK